MKAKRLVYALPALIQPVIHTVEAQPPGNVPQIGYLAGRTNPSTRDPLIDAFRQGLCDLSYTEGKNILVEYR
jgi:hypothetical protein